MLHNRCSIPTSRELTIRRLWILVPSSAHRYSQNATTAHCRYIAGHMKGRKYHSFRHWPQASRQKRYFNYLHIIHGEQNFYTKTHGADIWKNLYEFPLIETSKAVNFLMLSQTDDFQHLFPENINLSVDHRLTIKHQLTHQAIHTQFYRLEISAEIPFNPPPDFIRIEEKDLTAYPVSRLTDRYIEII